MTSADLTAAYGALLADRIRLTGRIEELRAAYKSASPFPHLIFKDLFSEVLLDSLVTEMSSMRPDQWSNIEQDARERTLRMRSALELGVTGGQLISIVNSAPFLCLLSEITGVWQLLPDPYLQGGGYASMRRGDYFSVHSDRNVAYDTGLTRRLAMIVFLNRDWKSLYAGQLELWNDKATECEVSIEPQFNTTVLFEVASPNYHGVPTPLNCPAELRRQSFIVYYHTVENGGNASIKPHSTIFAPRLYGSNRMTVRAVVQEIVPRIVLRAIRKLGELFR